jgi:hypothetical protein
MLVAAPRLLLECPDTATHQIAQNDIIRKEDNSKPSRQEDDHGRRLLKVTDGIFTTEFMSRHWREGESERGPIKSIGRGSHGETMSARLLTVHLATSSLIHSGSPCSSGYSLRLDAPMAHGAIASHIRRLACGGLSLPS